MVGVTWCEYMVRQQNRSLKKWYRDGFQIFKIPKRPHFRSSSSCHRISRGSTKRCAWKRRLNKILLHPTSCDAQYPNLGMPAVANKVETLPLKFCWYIDSTQSCKKVFIDIVNIWDWNNVWAATHCVIKVKCIISLQCPKPDLNAKWGSLTLKSPRLNVTHIKTVYMFTFKVESNYTSTWSICEFWWIQVLPLLKKLYLQASKQGVEEVRRTPIPFPVKITVT